MTLSDNPSKIIPNSFQTPNFYVDECMQYLTGNEVKCLIFLGRKTFGWQKRSDRISKSQINMASGLGNETIDKAMTYLVKIGLVIRIAENDGANHGVEWALQTDSSQIRFDLMKLRQLDLENNNRKKTSKARQKRNDKGGGVVEQTHPEKTSVEQKVDGGGVVEQTGGGDVQQTGGGVVGHPPQKTIKATRKYGSPDTVHLGAEAPARASASERIAQFPEDCRVGVQCMHEVFNLLPPEKPEPGEKGGDFALWINGIRALDGIAQEYQVPFEQSLRLVYQRWNQSPFTVSHPGALKKIMSSALAQQTHQHTPSTPSEDEFSLAEHMKNFIPRKIK